MQWKHFVYLTEDKLYYIRRHGQIGWLLLSGFQACSQAGRRRKCHGIPVREVYNFKGRKVTVIVGVKWNHVVNLPASTKSTALQMAEKQLLILGGERGTASGSRFLSFFSGRNAAGRGLYSAEAGCGQ